jgi:hypothetical protein
MLLPSQDPLADVGFDRMEVSVVYNSCSGRNPKLTWGCETAKHKPIPSDVHPEGN